MCGIGCVWWGEWWVGWWRDPGGGDRRLRQHLLLRQRPLLPTRNPGNPSAPERLQLVVHPPRNDTWMGSSSILEDAQRQSPWQPITLSIISCSSHQTPTDDSYVIKTIFWLISISSQTNSHHHHYRRRQHHHPPSLSSSSSPLIIAMIVYKVKEHIESDPNSNISNCMLLDGTWHERIVSDTKDIHKLDCGVSLLDSNPNPLDHLLLLFLLLLLFWLFCWL